MQSTTIYLKMLNALNALIIVSLADLNSIVIFVTMDSIWFKKANNIQATVQNVMTIVSLVLANLKIVSHANLDTL